MRRDSAVIVPRRALLVLFLLTLLLPAMANSQGGQLIYLDQVTLGEDGSFRLPDEPPPALKLFLERNLAGLAKGDCFQAEAPAYSLGEQRETGSELALRQQAIATYVGPVLETRPAFFLGVFGLIVIVEVELASGPSKGDLLADPESVLRIFYPKGRVDVGGLCLYINNAQLPEPPRRGDQLLYVQLSQGEVEWKTRVAFPFWNSVFLQRRAGGGRFDVPVAWAGPDGVQAEQGWDHLLESLGAERD